MSRRKKNVLYMMVSKDKYELPLMVEDTMKGLARRAGVSSSTVVHSITNARTRGTKSQYIEICMEEGDPDG